MTIWTLTANPALDLTYRIPALRHGCSHRLEEKKVRAGGKGLNVSQVLGQLGVSSVATGFLGGENGRYCQNLLSQSLSAPYITQRFITVKAETRLSIAVVDTDATVMNEAGIAPSNSEWNQLIGLIASHVASGDILACCGSFPGDSHPHWMTRIVETAHDAGARVLVDATGATLEYACDAGADFVKPNDSELRATTGCDSVAQGAQKLLERGAGVVITSGGDRGMSLHALDGAYRARPARRIAGNPTGAGDASVAAWCAFFLSHPAAYTAKEMSAGLMSAVALSGAAVACPVAGEVDLSLYEEMLPLVKVEKYSCPL